LLTDGAPKLREQLGVVVPIPSAFPDMVVWVVRFPVASYWTTALAVPLVDRLMPRFPRAVAALGRSPRLSERWRNDS
jgi:hypothetical protein